MQLAYVPVTPSHFVGPSPYPGVGKCHFHINAKCKIYEYKG